MTRREDVMRLSSGTGERIEVRELFRGRLFLQGLRILTLPYPLRRERRSALAVRYGVRVQRING